MSLCNTAHAFGYCVCWVKRLCAQYEMALSGEVVCITCRLGMPRSYYEDQVATAGGTVSHALSNKVTILVAADPGASSAKLAKARARGTRVVGKDFFTTLHSPVASLAPLPSSAHRSEERKVLDLGKYSTAVRHSAAAQEPAPLTILREGQVVRVAGRSVDYEVRHRGGNYYCTCPAWRNQQGGPARTCKHLKQVLGADYDAWRMRAVQAEPESAERGTNVPARSSGTEITRSAIAQTSVSAGAGAGASAGGGKSAAGTASRVRKTAVPALILAEKWADDKHDPTGWWISEKYDGLRAFWDGTQFVSRAGNTFFAPEFFTQGLPHDITLDGELYLGRRRFEETSSIVRTQNAVDPRWNQLRFMVFDAPSVPGPFEQRLQILQKHVAGHKFAHVVVHWKAKSRGDVLEQRDAACAQGAEGLMLRRPQTVYVGKRTSDLLKAKVWHDEEAEVVGHVMGAGKHEGRLGALECRRVNSRTDVRFRVGTGFSDAQRSSPPPVGTLITFKYQELTTGGIPRFPVFLRVAEDQPDQEQEQEQEHEQEQGHEQEREKEQGNQHLDGMGAVGQKKEQMSRVLVQTTRKRKPAPR